MMNNRSTGDNWSISTERGDRMDMESMRNNNEEKAAGNLRMGAPYTPGRYEEHR